MGCTLDQPEIWPPAQLCTAIVLIDRLLDSEVRSLGVAHAGRSAYTHFVISRNDGSSRTRSSCRIVCFNRTKIASLRASLPKESILEAAAARNKALAHPARLAVLAVLAVEACCVCDLANVLGLPLSTLSQHLKTLRKAGLVCSRQEGKLVFYSLSDGTHSRQESVAAVVSPA